MVAIAAEFGPASGPTRSARTGGTTPADVRRPSVGVAPDGSGGPTGGSDPGRCGHGPAAQLPRQL